MQSITDCLNGLALSDTEHGMAHGRIKGLEHRIKVCKSVETLKAEGKSIAEREHIAMASDEYAALVKEYEDNCMDFKVLDSRRKTWELTISVWQTQRADQRKGNVI